MVKEIDDLKYYAKELKAEIDYLIEVNKTGEPRLSGIYGKIAGLNTTIETLEKLLVPKAETPMAPVGVAKIDVKTGIKKVYHLD